MVFGTGSIAQAVLSKGIHGNIFSINLAFGIGAMMGVYVAGGISGGHLNPAVTLALAVTKKFPWRKIPAYFAGQYLGAFFATSIVYFVYSDALQNYTGGNLQVIGPNATAAIWATYPTEGITRGILFFDQIVGTALLLFCGRAITDEKNMAVPSYLVPVLVGLLVLNIGICFGHNCGYPINPARDLSPRILSLAIGYGTETFSAFDYWFYVPIVGPHCGAILGSLLYEVFVNLHWPNEEL